MIFSLMKRKWLIIIVAVLALVLVGLIFKSKFFNRQGPGALQISTTPRAVVYLDGSQVGVTPFFDDKIKSGEHTLKLVPESTTDSLVSWEGKVNLLPGILTVVNRNFGSSESNSSGEMLTLERIGRKDRSSLAVISVPDQAVVKIAGEPRGFTPLTVDDLTPGDYSVVISAPGYEEKSISASTIGGYKLIINVQLAQQMEGIEGATESAENEDEQTDEAAGDVTPTPAVKATPATKATLPAKPYVTVKDTPTGWLRVRAEPSTSADEVAKINVGESFPYLNEEDNGWYKLEHEKGEEGWASGVYLDLVE